MKTCVLALVVLCVVAGATFAGDSDMFKGRKPTIPNIELPKIRPDVKVDQKELNSLVSGVKTMFEAGIKICRGLVEPWIKAVLPGVELPDWVFYLAGMSVFTLILSTFLSVPLSVIFLFAAVLGYAFLF